MFPHHREWTPAGCLKLNSILTLSTERYHQIPQVKGSALQLHLCFSPTSHRSEVLPRTPSLCLINSLEWLKLRKLIYSLDYQLITKDIK